MSYLKSVETAISHIEEHIMDDDLNVPSVCKKTGVSQWYFQRIFKGVTGDSLGDYIRKRRISLAALELVDSDRPIIQLAIDYGFESQESFTRAFKGHFDATPAKFRKNRDPKMFMHKFQLTNEFLRHLKERLKMTPVIENTKEMKLVGFRKPFRGVFDENPNNHEVIPKLWQEFEKRRAEIPNKIDGNTYGVVNCKEVDGKEHIEYMAAIEVSEFDDLPKGMVSYIFPEGKLARFTHKGSPEGIEKTLKYVFGTWLPQSKNRLREGLELEVYPKNYRPTDSNSSFEYCLALQ